MDETITQLLQPQLAQNQSDDTSNEAANQLVGTVLNQRFELEEVIGRGGMGVVYKARDQHKVAIGEPYPYVAIKVLHEKIKHVDEALVALQRETYKEQQLSSPNIVRVYDFDRDQAQDIVYKTMELVEGISLKQWRLANQPCDGEVSKAYLQSVLHIVIQIAKGLEHAHEQGIIHSDLKPSNVMITTGEQVKLLDFGIARTVLQNQDTKADLEAAFTPAYASLEMLSGEAPDPRDDLYALGCILYELLEGKHPFDKQSALVALEKSLKPKPFDKAGIPDHLWPLVQDLLALERRKRLSSASQVMTRLQAPVQAKSRHHIMRYFALLIVVILAVVVLSHVVLTSFRHKAQRDDSAIFQVSKHETTSVSAQNSSSSAAQMTVGTTMMPNIVSKAEQHVSEPVKSVVTHHHVAAKPQAKSQKVEAKTKPKPKSVKPVAKPKIIVSSPAVHQVKSVSDPNSCESVLAQSHLTGLKPGTSCLLTAKNHASDLKIDMRVVSVPKSHGQLVALSQNLVDLKSYAQFCQATGLCISNVPDAQLAKQPVLGLNPMQIHELTNWFSQVSGFVVQLPSNQLWQQTLYQGMERHSICDYYGTGPHLVPAKAHRHYRSRFHLDYSLASNYEWLYSNGVPVLRGTFFSSAVKPYCRVMQVATTAANQQQAGFRLMLVKNL